MLPKNFARRYELDYEDIEEYLARNYVPPQDEEDLPLSSGKGAFAQRLYPFLDQFRLSSDDGELNDDEECDEDLGDDEGYEEPQNIIPQFLHKNKDQAIRNAVTTLEERFPQLLMRLIDEKGLKDSDVYKRADVDRRTFSKLRSDPEYKPSKKTAISFALALELSLDETKKLLERAGYALSPSSRFDMIISCMIEMHEYNLNYVNYVLEQYGEDTLSRLP